MRSAASNAPSADQPFDDITVWSSRSAGAPDSARARARSSALRASVAAAAAEVELAQPRPDVRVGVRRQPVRRLDDVAVGVEVDAPGGVGG